MTQVQLDERQDFNPYKVQYMIKLGLVVIMSIVYRILSHQCELWERVNSIQKVQLQDKDGNISNGKKD